VVEFLANSFGWKMVSDKEMDEFATVLSQEMGKSTVCDSSRMGKIENRSGYYSMIRTFKSFLSAEDMREALKDCRVPTLIMRGECDGIKWGYFSEYLQYFPNHKFLIIPGAGHTISREQPELYIQNIQDFLKQ
jgi:proline iminopeptidase